jgi:hypothetical protein
MAKKNNDRKRAGNQAARIRERIRQGKPVPKAQMEWLAEWEKEKAPTGPPVKPSTSETVPPEAESKTDPATDSPQPEANPATPIEHDTEVAASQQPTEAGPPAEAGNLAEVPPLKSPPKILASDGKVGGGDWRDKYRAAAEGREALCVMAAEEWVNLLADLHDYIEGTNRKPVLSRKYLEEVIGPACVLTVDSILPEKFVLTPAVTSSVGSTLILVQAAVAKARGPRVKKGEPADRGPAPGTPAAEVPVKQSDPPPAPQPSAVEVRPDPPKEVAALEGPTANELLATKPDALF